MRVIAVILHANGTRHAFQQKIKGNQITVRPPRLFSCFILRLRRKIYRRNCEPITTTTTTTNAG